MLYSSLIVANKFIYLHVFSDIDPIQVYVVMLQWSLL